MTSHELAQALEVVPRTIYRDIAALQAMRVPIEGEAGIGYVMRAGFDLPPLMFTTEEVEAIVVGLALPRRTGDLGLQSAADGVCSKIAEVLPDDRDRDLADWPLYVSGWGAGAPRRVDLRVPRGAIREEEKLRITYEDSESRRTRRVIKPLALLYYVEVVVLSAWCELRRALRHFRADRIVDCKATGQRFPGEGDKLRAIWREQHQLP